MRDRLFLVAIGILSTVAWILTADAGRSAQGQTHGSAGRGGTHSGGFEGPAKHGARHPVNIGLAFQPEMRELFAGQPEPAPPAPGMLVGDLGVGGPDHSIAVHLLGPGIHLLTHLAVRFEGGEAVTPQPTVPSAGDSDQGGAATAQPDPNSSPLPPRPPGAAGPGRPVSAWSSPGLPGPGRPARPRW
jgi:hypothetical protein